MDDMLENKCFFTHTQSPKYEKKKLLFWELHNGKVFFVCWLLAVSCSLDSVVFCLCLVFIFMRFSHLSLIRHDLDGTWPRFYCQSEECVEFWQQKNVHSFLSFFVSLRQFCLIVIVNNRIEPRLVEQQPECHWNVTV